MLSEFFQNGPIPAQAISGSYSFGLVILSYFVATAASYIALDLTGRLRDVNTTGFSKTLWLLCGSFALGAGIWSMHFIGMLAFIMPMPMDYDLLYTGLSMIVAVFASLFALYLLKDETTNITHLAVGGIILGLGIASMHYLGMAAMNMHIQYVPSIFILSIVIAILASEAALVLAIKSNHGVLKKRIRLKLISAFVMGAAICGMHYTGMFAAIFTPNLATANPEHVINPEFLSLLIATVTFFILGIAFAASTYKEIMNYQAVKLAHQGGMAEVAGNVLHNVGNTLNSVNISASVINDYVSRSELKGLIELKELLNSHKQDLSQFVATSSGAELPSYIEILANTWENENKSISAEIQKLTYNIQHIKEIIAMQQTFSIMPHFEQIVIVPEMIDEALSIAIIENNHKNIKIEKHYQNIKPLFLEKVKILQILINLIRNAKQSLIESKVESKLIVLKTMVIDKKWLAIQVIDNGLGISPENMKMIFIHGFSTKKDGHGFGLHASAISAKEIGGQLKVESLGLGKGAQFTLEIPYKISMKGEPSMKGGKIHA